VRRVGHPWRAVLFDLDGTLADTTALIVECFQRTVEAHLGERLPPERWLATMGRPLRVQMRDFARDEAEWEAMVATYNTHQEALHDGRVRAFDHAAEVLDALRAAGVPVALVTSKGRRMTERTLSCCGLAERIEVCVCGDEVERPKPDPEPVRRALDLLGTGPGGEDVLFVGDSPFDVRAGRAAGVRTAAALWGPFSESVLACERPHHTLRALPDLLVLRP